MRRSFLCLAVCLLLSASGCQNGSESNSISSGLDKHKKQQAEKTKEGSRSAVVEAINQDSSSNLTKMAQDSLPSQVTELMSKLARLEIEQLRESDPTKSVLLQKQRVLASARLLDSELGIEQKREAVRIHLDALTQLARFKDPVAVEQFRQFVEKWKLSGDAEITKTVVLANLTFDYATQRLNAQTDLAFVTQSIGQLANRYPSDLSVFSQLTRIAQDTLQKGDTEAWRQMSQTLVAVYGSSEQANLRNAAARLQHQLDASNSNLKQIAQRIASDAPAALDEWEMAVRTMLETNNSQEDVHAFGRTLRWLESNASTRQALKANQVVANLSQTKPINPLKQMLARNCSLRHTRLNLIGKPLAIDATSARGGRLNWNTITNDRQTMVVFWSPNNLASIRFVQHMAKLYEHYQSNNVQLVAVNVTDSSKANKVFGDSLPEWEIALIAEERKSFAQNASASLTLKDNVQVLQRYGIESLPQLITVNTLGFVEHVNPEIKDLEKFLSRSK